MDKEVESGKTADKKQKKPLWRRLVRGLLWFLGGTLVFLLVALLTLPLWINPVGTALAKWIVPGLTGTAFSIERVNLNPYTGKLLVSGVQLANPKGYSEKDAFTLGSLSVDVEVSSLLSDTIHVRDVTVDAPFASYVFDAEGVNNFDRIIEEVNKKLGPKKEKKESSETKVVVDKVTVKGVRAVVGAGVFELASLTLTDFGKDDAPAKVVISGVRLANPEGFPEPDAFSLKSLSIGMETGDLAKVPMVFHDIIVDSTYVGLVYNDAGDSNFDVILKPFKGDKPKEEKKDDSAEEKRRKEDDGPRVTIDKLDITGTKVQYRKISLPIPLPTFTDIGKSSKEGATAKEVVDQVAEKAKAAMGGLGDFAGFLGSNATNLLGGASNLLGEATSAISGGTSNVLSGAKGLLGNVLPGGDGKKDGEPGTAAKAVESAKNLGGSAVEGAKSLGGSAVEGAKSLGEGVKNLGGGALKSLGIGK